MGGIGIELRRLRAEHHQLRCLSDAILAKIAQPSADAAERLQPYWQEFRTVLIRHLKCEDWVLYPRLQSSMDHELSATATHMFRELGGLAAQLERFDTQWTATARQHDMQAYLCDMQAILAQVDHRTEHEEQKLFPMAANADAAGKMATSRDSAAKDVMGRNGVSRRGGSHHGGGQHGDGMSLGLDLMPRLA